jgi:predicted nucleic acid-binding protein
MEFVVNEWLPEFFKPNASKEEKEKLEKFLNRFIERDDKIYVRRLSEFFRKIHRYKKEFQNYSNVNEQLDRFIKLILINSERCNIVDDNEFELSQAIVEKLNESGNYSSDIYLFEAACVTETKLIITTDEKLKTHMKNNGIFIVQLLDEFLSSY